MSDKQTQNDTFSFSRKPVIIGSIAVALLLAGFGIGTYIHPFSSSTTNSAPDEVRQDSPQYKFINPLLLINTPAATTAPFVALQNQFTKYITTAEKNNPISSVSVYFQDLNSGLWTGVNEDEQYAPASMLKVGLMIAYLKESQSDPNILDKKLVYTGNADQEQFFKPEHPLVQGEEYTIQELLDALITQSDNNANNILIDNIDPSKIFQVYSDLKIPVPGSNTQADFMSAKDYSALFRTLYNATYLRKSTSELALQLLSNAEFTQGLEAGLPASTTVAHKFGERTAYDTAGNITERELHDCGIVYNGDSPYFLCVMTRGQNFTDLQQVISDISKMVYQSQTSSN